MSEELHGVVERVTFHSPESGFCVLQVKIKQNRDLATVVGNTVMVTPGEYIKCQGTWVNDKQHGLQFKATELSLLKPTTIEGIEKYLASGLVKGVGPGFAKVLVSAFGMDVFEVIENQPDRLTEVEGIGERRKASILAGWCEQKSVREIVVFLHAHGVGTSRAVRIYKTYGNNAIAKLTENPYRLALDIHGIGFKTADKFAIKLGVDTNSVIRAVAGIIHVLQTYNAEGHCGILLTDMQSLSAKLLDIEEHIIQQAIEQEISSGRLIIETIEDREIVFLSGIYQIEKQIAKKLFKLVSSEYSWQGISVDKAIAWVENKNSIRLSSSQQAAIKQVVTNKLCIITGGPGVGKTTVVNSILQILAKKTSKIMLCAPTGRAAKRLAETTSMPAKTIHRLLSFEPGLRTFKFNSINPLPCDLLVVDEVSMIDIKIFNSLLDALPSTAALILVGDVDQLPSVGIGAVLSDLIRSRKIATVRLTEIFRQASNSQIIVNAHKINNSELPFLNVKYEQQDFYFVKTKSPEETQHKLLNIVVDRIPDRFKLDPLHAVQILTPMNRGSLGARSLNLELKNRLNHSKSSVNRFGTDFSEGDKVIQTVNNYDKEVFNGDIGFIQHLDFDLAIVTINFEGRDVDYDFNELDEVSLAYAITIHKSQGSEYPAVVIPIGMQQFTMLQKNLLYTGVTRGKQLVVLVGEVKALAIAVKNSKSQQRITTLSNRLIETFSKNDSLITE